MSYRFRLMLLAALVLPPRAVPQVPFGTLPGWISSDLADYSTGAGWADINGDGLPDLVVANGNDMGRQHVVVYYNTGSGSLAVTPGWQSADIDYHGQLSIADVNGDGFPDVAVCVYIGPSGFSSRGRVKLYMNSAGTLGPLPAWTSADSFYTFSCSFGDADGDGDPDLAVAAGEIYGSRSERNRVYFNRNGVLDSLPGWRSAQPGYSYDVAWCDFDNDGDLDLAYACEGGPNRIYRNAGDSIGTVPVWTSADTSRYANSLCAADVNNDGWQDLAVSDNYQLGGEGRFKIYLNTAGLPGTTPAWSSAAGGFGSGITLVDVDTDGWRDLVVGGWWEPLRIFRNQFGTFSTDPVWTSATASVVETIVCADVDADGLDTLDQHFTGDGMRKLFLLTRTPFYSRPTVLVGGVTLAPDAFWCDTETGALSLASAPAPGVAVDVRCIASHDADVAVSNWDNSLGNYLFYNTTISTAVASGSSVADGFRLLQNYPNPFNGQTRIGYRARGTGGSGGGPVVSLRVYDVLGREVAVMVDGPVEPGEHVAVFNGAGLPSGVYYCRIRCAGFTSSIAMMHLK